MPHALSLIFFFFISFVFRSLNFSIILHLSLLLFSPYSFISPNFTSTYKLLTVDMSPFYNFHIFSFSLGFISGFHKFLILAYNHLINIHITIPRKIPKLAQLYPEYIIIFIIKIVGYFWGVTTLPHLIKFRPRNYLSQTVADTAAASFPHFPKWLLRSCGSSTVL